MNKLSKILLGILGAIEVVFSIFMPIAIAILWIHITSYQGVGSYFLYGLGLLSSIFRAIKTGGWLKWN
jgi:uncharacterized membrane protein